MAPALFMNRNPLNTSVYIDGFNLYHRSLRGTPYKWLDFKKLLSKILPPNCNVTCIKYFTANVADLGDPSRPQRQATYIQALEAFIPEIEVVYGQFKSHPLWLPVADRNFPSLSADMYKRGSENQLVFERVIKTEEKGSDVNLAVHILNDAWLNRYDCAVLLSNDSDLAGALSLIRERPSRKKIFWVIPFDAAFLRSKISGKPVRDEDCLWPSTDLKALVHWRKQIGELALQTSQLPNIIPATSIHKPIDWCCGVVAKYPFEMKGLDFDAIFPQLVANGYVTTDGRVCSGFLKVENGFKSSFPDYTKDQFNEIQSILHKFRQS